MEDLPLSPQDEQVIGNSRHPLALGPGWECPSPPQPLPSSIAQWFAATPDLLTSSESCETTLSLGCPELNLSCDSGLGTSSPDPDDGPYPSLCPSTVLDANMQSGPLNYSNSSEQRHSPRGNLLPSSPGGTTNSCLKGYIHTQPPVSDCIMVAEVPFIQSLQPATIWHEPSPFYQERDTPREVEEGKAAPSGIQASNGKAELNAPGKSAIFDAEDQTVNRPDSGDILGCAKSCSLSPISKGLHTHFRQAQHTDELPDGNLKTLGEKRDMIDWVVSTKDAGSALTSLPSPGSNSCSFKTVPRVYAAGDSLSSIRKLDETRDLIRELLQTLSHQDFESSFDQVSSVGETPVESTYSSPPPNDGSGTDTSPKSGTSAGASSFEIGSKRSHPTRDDSSQEVYGDETPRKQPRQEKNPSNQEVTTTFQGRIQMPCPVQQPQKCQGTNATISELLRSLEVRHRIVICKDCCTQVNVPEDERKPENARKRHKLETCEARCIGTTCNGTANDGAPYHRRTENCPTWQSLPSEIRWCFIWGLINPGENPPDPDFYNGVGYEHNTTRRPCKQQSRPRGADICDALMRDIEERDKRRVSLEAELIATNERNVQLQENHKKRVGNLENIIETLLERLEENNVKLPNSLQKRLQEECPGVFCEPVAQLISKRTQAPPTPSSMFKDGTGEMKHSQLNQPTTALVQPPLFSSAGPGDGYSQPFDFDLSGELFTNFNHTDGVMVDPSQQLPDGMA